MGEVPLWNVLSVIYSGTRAGRVHAIRQGLVFKHL